MSNQDLYNSISNITERQSNAQNIPIKVTGYILPGNAVPTTENTRIQGINLLTGENVEVALRDMPEGKGSVHRKTIRDFYDDSASGATAVTTNIGGTIVADYAFPDPSLNTLGNASTVFSSSWLNRIAHDPESGYSITATARVNTAQQKNRQNPLAGHYQTVSILADNAYEIADEEALYKGLVYSLNPIAQAADNKNGMKRPGRPTAYLRVSSGNDSMIVDIHCRFEEINGVNQPVSDQNKIRQELNNNPKWQQIRAYVIEGISKKSLKIEVIPGSTMSVGSNTVQKNVANKYSQVTGVNEPSIKNGTNTYTPSFSRMTIGVKCFPEHNRNIVTYARAVDKTPRHNVSAQGIINPVKVAQNSVNAPQSPAPNKKTPPSPRQSVPSAESAPATHQPAPPKTARITTTTDPAITAIELSMSITQQEGLSLASKTKSRFIQAKNQLLFDSVKLPAVITALEQSDTGIEIKVDPAIMEQGAPNNTQAQRNTHTHADQKASSPSHAPVTTPKEPQPKPKPKEPQSLDMSTLNIDDICNDLFQDKEPQHGHTEPSR